MSGHVVRRMRPEDVDEALAVFADVAAEGRWIGTQAGFDRSARRRQWLLGLADPGAASLVVQDEATGLVIGNGSVRLAPFGVAELGIALAASARGRGIGGRLLDALISAARELGAHKVELQVWPHNEPALRLYMSRGFKVEGRLRRHYPRGNEQLWDAVIMGLALGDARAVSLPSIDGTVLGDAACLPATLQVRDQS